MDSAHFASQQRGDPDFTDAEKTRMAAALLDKSPAAFLTRFGKSLGESHLAFFEENFSHGDPEVHLCFLVMYREERQVSDYVALT